MRLADRLLDPRMRFFGGDAERPGDITPAVKQRLQRDVIVDVTSVGEWMQSSQRGRQLGDIVEGYVIRPPFPAFVMVYDFGGTRLDESGEEIGIGLLLLVDETAKGALRVEGYIAYSDHVAEVSSRAEVEFDDDGKVSTNIAAMLSRPSWRGLDYEVGATQVGIALCSLQFMNCKNITIGQAEESPKLRRAFQKRHGRPKAVYHVLNIEPMKQVIRREGGDGCGFAKAMHICRGHFREYTETRKLFGRLTGRFWVPAHVRGNADEGVVTKDYRVNMDHVHG